MTGNTFGRIFRVTTAGESYAGAFRKDAKTDPRLYGGLVTIIDGVPAGLEITADTIHNELDKRKPGQSELDTKRAERDKAYILTGVMEDDLTTGAPVTIYIPNTDIEDMQVEKHKSFKGKVRPGQAAYTYLKKYGEFADWYGAGRASGRETAARVAAGAVARAVLNKLGIDILAYTVQVYDIGCELVTYETAKKNYRSNAINCPDPGAAVKMTAEILKAREEGETLGGIIEMVIKNVPAGIGDPVFDKLEALLSHGLMSIGAVRGIEFGKGFEIARSKGSRANDRPFFSNDLHKVCFETNNAGGILGGISTGEEIRIRVAVKPTPTIAKKQWTIDTDTMTNEEVAFTTRNDPCILPRIYPVCEAMAAMTLVDAIMINNGYSSLQCIDGKWKLL